MALTTILRRSAAVSIPLAARVIGTQQVYHHTPAAPLFAAAFNTTDLGRREVVKSDLFGGSVRGFSSNVAVKRPASDGSLLRTIESEIECAEESVESQVQEIPEGFPFQIEDNPGQQTISLSREYQGEIITVEVETSSLISDENDEDGDDDNDAEKSFQSSVPMVVRVSKDGVPTLEFCVTAYPDEITIDSMSIKDPEASDDQLAYEGPNFEDLDENLQKGFHKYLEIRGIKPSTTNFLHEYMINKEHREYTNWLKNLKKFVEA